MHTRIRERLTPAWLLGLVLSGVVVVMGASAADAADPCGPSGNEISCENTKQGSPPSEWEIDGAGDEGLQGFATDISVNKGQRVDFKIDTDASDYDITIYRTGWYGGAGARRIAEVQPSASLPQQQPACLVDVATDMVDCGNWGVSASWNVPANAVSGVYIAHLEDPATQDESHITFIVRDDASDSDIAFQTSDTTWQAYNTYGGASLYQGTHLGRATKVSYNRPFYTREGTPWGRDFYFANEYPMVRFLERNGYDVSYLAGVDTDRRGQLLTNHDVFLSVGHDEYWSGRQRANVEAARDAGVNLQFLSGNEVYWRTRWENSIDGNGTPYRTLVTYKETAAGGKVDPSSEWTGTWRDPRFAAPADGGGLVENALTGTAYMVNFSDLALTVPAAEGRMRLWRNTSVATQPAGGQVTLAPHTVGYESDEDLVNHMRPDGLIRLSETTGEVPEYLQDFGTEVKPGTTTHHLTLYRASSGALVFGAGTVQWSWGLDATHDTFDEAPADPRMQQAQVNLLADMGAMPQTLMSGLVAATASADQTGPTVQVTTPVPGNPVPNGTEVTVSGTATDTGGGQVAGVEVSTDGGETWRPASGRASWTHTYVQQGQGQTDVLVRAMDDSANIGPTRTRTVQVACPCSVFGPEQPDVPAANDAGAVELGLRFSPERDGFVSGVRFYKGQGNTGVHTGTLWSDSGQRLAEVTFSGETATGWQEAEFDTAVPVTSGTSYVVSYTAPNGHYAVANEALAAVGRDAFPLSVAGGFGATPAGVYADPGRFPDRSFGRAHYYVDPMFITVDEAPLGATDHWPAPDAASIPVGTEVRATFSKPVVQGSPEMSVARPDGSALPGASSYDAGTRTLTFTPQGALSPFTVYEVTVDAEDPQGRAVTSGGTWRFRTARPDATPGVCPCTIFDDSTPPTLLEDVDTVPVTLGMRFSPTKPGAATGIRFYRGPRNSGPHTGTLWSADGQVLAEGTFSGAWKTGWQELTFDDPVELTPGEEYVVSYRAPAGRYSATINGFSAQNLSRGPLQVFSDSGAYTYGQGFPTSRSNHSYLVDVVYEADAPIVQLAETSPTADANGVPRDAQVSAWFSNPLANGATLVARVAGNPVAGTAALSSDGQRFTFTPDQPWPLDTPVQVTLAGVVSQEGAQLPAQQWSFRTTTDQTASQTLLGTGTPAAEGVNDSGAVELGMVWTPAVDGTVTQVRFFKGAGNTGAHVGSLWAMDGTRLATVDFGDETPSGWQSATLDQPVDVTAGTSYVVSYYAPIGSYSATSQYFGNPRTVGDLTAPSGANGLYVYASGGGFPTGSWGSSNYWVDVRFVPEPPTLEISSRSPSPDSDQVSVGSAPRITFSDEIAPGWAMTASTGGNPVAGTATRSSDGRTLTFQPSSALPAGATVQVRVVNIESARGATLPDETWQFTTEAQATQRWSLFEGVVPANSAVNDPSAVELGTVFTTDVAGDITAIRFHKGPGNTGTHIGSVWSMSGERLAQVAFTGESATGWQEAQLTTPLPVQAGTSYVVSYYAPNGNYSTTPWYFDVPRQVGPLSTPASANGRYRYGAGGGFPTGSFRATNYFVDVVLRAPGS